MEKEILKKAKRFDEALAMAKECITYVPDEAVNKYMLNMFPELKESEDDRIRKEIIDFICWATDRGCITKEQREKSNSWLAWLEKQKEQKPIEWSEEDEYCKHQLIVFCENCMQPDSGAIRCANWLKSLRPQNRWKPSEEQIKAVRLARSFVVDDFDEHPALSEILIELEEQLKKLREE